VRAEELTMEKPTKPSELGAAVVMQPVDAEDAAVIDRLRAAVRSQKGARWRIEGRKAYDALLESVPAHARREYATH